MSRLVYWKDDLYDSRLGAMPDDDPYPTRAQDGKANLIGSLTAEGTHMPVLDIDFSAQLVPSGTPGHFHLYLNKAIPWEKYEAVIVAMREAGLIQPGYANWGLRRHQTFVRLPGTLKPHDGPPLPEEPEEGVPF